MYQMLGMTVKPEMRIMLGESGIPGMHSTPGMTALPIRRGMLRMPRMP